MKIIGIKPNIKSLSLQKSFNVRQIKYGYFRNKALQAMIIEPKNKLWFQVLNYYRKLQSFFNGGYKEVIEDYKKEENGEIKILKTKKIKTIKEFKGNGFYVKVQHVKNDDGSQLKTYKKSLKLGCIDEAESGIVDEQGNYLRKTLRRETINPDGSSKLILEEYEKGHLKVRKIVENNYNYREEYFDIKTGEHIKTKIFT